MLVLFWFSLNKTKHIATEKKSVISVVLSATVAKDLGLVTQYGMQESYVCTALWEDCTRFNLAFWSWILFCAAQKGHHVRARAILLLATAGLGGLMVPGSSGSTHCTQWGSAKTHSQGWYIFRDFLFKTIPFLFVFKARLRLACFKTSFTQHNIGRENWAQ